jgi:inward rectifier potassium channel
VDEADFLSALSFSVQTFTTIGYGTMTPETDYAHVVRIVEAFVGLLGAALVTGVIFAKASRQVSSVLFSEPIVITIRNGVPTLVFRMGNARGSEVVEAASA